MQEISNQCQIVAGAKIGFEGAAWKEMVAISDTHRLGILLCDFEHILPIGGVDVRGGVLFCDGDPEYAVTRSDIEYFVGFTAFAEFRSYDLGGFMHQRHHAVGKLHPVGIFGLEHSFAQRGATATDGLGQLRVTVP